MKYIKTKKLALRLVAIALIAVVSLPITYKSFETLRDASAVAYNALDTTLNVFQTST